MNWIGWVMTVLLLAGVVYLPVERAERMDRVRDGARAQTAPRHAAFTAERERMAQEKAVLAARIAAAEAQTARQAADAAALAERVQDAEAVRARHDTASAMLNSVLPRFEEMKRQSLEDLARLDGAKAKVPGTDGGRR